ncbi:MAG: hypothetical protein QM204_05280 [Bacillota bacterium]|jgi:hypothetical protein|nr:hypothetical protein [Bacillota bacterium]NLL26037.1 hypothetical protein [Erysipelotrichia bacterium]
MSYDINVYVLKQKKIVEVVNARNKKSLKYFMDKISLNLKEALLTFCKNIQKAAL